MSLVTPNCPAGCNATPPKPYFNFCDPDINEGQIDRIYFANPDYPLTDWTDQAEWLTRISNTSNNANAIRYIEVIGSKAAAESNDVAISLKRTITLNKTHTIEFRIDETNHLNYEFLRTIECNNSYVFWYRSGKYLYGGNDGISAKQIKMNDVIPEAYTELETFNGTITWDATFHPERIGDPLA